MSERPIPAAVMKQAAGKVKEAAQMLAILKPYLARPDKLSEAEQRILLDTVQEASSLLTATLGTLYRAKFPQPGDGLEAPVRARVPGGAPS